MSYNLPLGVGCFIHRYFYGYGEITTVDEDGGRVFIDFMNGHYDWFGISELQRVGGHDVFPVEKAFIRYQFKEGDNLKDVLNMFPDYRFLRIAF